MRKKKFFFKENQISTKNGGLELENQETHNPHYRLPSPPPKSKDNDVVMNAATNNKDFNFVMESPLSRIAKSLSTNYGQLTSNEVRVLFNDNTAAVRDSNQSSNTKPEEVLVCSSNSSFQRKSSLLKTKTKS
ncbi:Mechanosensitive ion channel protein [Forsythia ovata]|uniref:Mechanosensitive ion channel protein n=1 Tax=Forsythia ovata TaxID=205694 RepID=A0ABD1SPW9_9LAMI